MVADDLKTIRLVIRRFSVFLVRAYSPVALVTAAATGISFVVLTWFAPYPNPQWVKAADDLEQLKPQYENNERAAHARATAERHAREDVESELDRLAVKHLPAYAASKELPRVEATLLQKYWLAAEKHGSGYAYEPGEDREAKQQKASSDIANDQEYAGAKARVDALKDHLQKLTAKDAQRVSRERALYDRELQKRVAAVLPKRSSNEYAGENEVSNAYHAANRIISRDPRILGGEYYTAAKAALAILLGILFVLAIYCSDVLLTKRDGGFNLLRFEMALLAMGCIVSGAAWTWLAAGYDTSGWAATALVISLSTFGTATWFFMKESAYRRYVDVLLAPERHAQWMQQEQQRQWTEARRAQDWQAAEFRRAAEQEEEENRRSMAERAKVTEKLRKEQARADCELLFNLHAADIIHRFTKPMLDEFMSKYMNDKHLVDDVERRGRELQRIIEQHREEVERQLRPRALEGRTILSPDDI